MNKKDKYFGDTRYEKVWEQMKLLNIEDITTDRQHKNGTIVWKLPTKDQDTGWYGRKCNYLVSRMLAQKDKTEMVR